MSFLQPVKHLVFLGLQINTEEMTLRRETDSYNLTMPKCLLSTNNLSVEFDKLISLLLSTLQAILPRKTQFPQFTPIEANIYIKHEKAG